MGLLDGVNNAKRSFLDKPWAGKAKVVKVKTSLEEKDYKGKPYIAFVLALENGILQEARFWTPVKEDDADKSNNKLLRIKTFLENAGVDPSLPEATIYEHIIGKEMYAAFSQREYIGKEKTGRPALKKGVDFAYSNPISKPFTNVNEASLTRGLKPEEWGKLKAAQNHWDATNNPLGTAAEAGSTPAVSGEAMTNASLTDEVDDDLPF
jgi:hypothetical protein